MPSFIRRRVCRSTLKDRTTHADVPANNPRQAIDDNADPIRVPGRSERLSLSSLTLSCERLPLRRPELGPALAAFAEGKRAGAGKYVTSRLADYDAVLVATDNEGIAAFALLQDFDDGGARFVYFGPLFSRGGAYLPLLTQHVGDLVAENPGRPLYLAAEIQNPKMLLPLYSLFPHSAFPRIQDGSAPAEIRGAAEVLAERLLHFGALDPATLATRSGETLYAAQPGCEPMMDWLRQRGIDLARGDSQLVIVWVGASMWERGGFILELVAGLASMRPGRGGLRRTLAAFRRAVHG